MSAIKEAFENTPRCISDGDLGSFTAGYLSGLERAAKECAVLDAQHKDACAYHCEEAIRQLAKEEEK
jgi:hypothetical protein